MKLQRRQFLKLLGASGLTMGTPLLGVSAQAQSMAPPDRFWVFFSASGGWDTTSLLDPKGDIDATGKGVVNHYSRSAIRQAGNIPYAPWPGIDDPGIYDRFFTSYSSDILVMNGIDMKTNAHNVGRAKIWSGSGGERYPCMAALIAACQHPELPLSFISNGYYDSTASVVPKTRVNNIDVLYGLALPNRVSQANTQTYFHEEIDAYLKQIESERLLRARELESLPQRSAQQSQLYTMRHSATEITRVIDKLPATVSANRLFRQAQIACAVFAAGIGVSANLETGGFDTHDDNDNRTATAHGDLLSGVEFLLQEAERQGIRDKLNIVVGSDFGRRPFYNNGNGKDHWPIGSAMFIGPDFVGNRVVGGTNNGLEARRVNKSNLAFSDSGSIITSEDVTVTLRSIAGISANPIAQRFGVAGQVLPIRS